MPTPESMVTVDDNGLGRVYFPQAGREFRERDVNRAGKARDFDLPAFANVQQLSAIVREVFADSGSRKLANSTHRGDIERIRTGSARGSRR